MVDLKKKIEISTCYRSVYVCLCLFASHFVTADEQGEWFRDIKKSSEKRHGKIPPLPISAKTLLRYYNCNHKRSVKTHHYL